MEMKKMGVWLWVIGAASMICGGYGCYESMAVGVMASSPAEKYWALAAITSSVAATIAGAGFLLMGSITLTGSKETA